VQLLFATWPLSLLPLFASSAPDHLFSLPFLSVLGAPMFDPLARSRCRNYCSILGWRDTLGPCARGQASRLAEITAGRRLVEERVTCTRAGGSACFLTCTYYMYACARTRIFPHERFVLTDNLAVRLYFNCWITLQIRAKVNGKILRNFVYIWHKKEYDEENNMKKI